MYLKHFITDDEVETGAHISLLVMICHTDIMKKRSTER